MRKTSLAAIALLWVALSASADEQQVVEIGVSGLACPFCVYGMEKNLGKLAGVESVTVDLARSAARITIRDGHEADVDAILAAIVSAGFTPGEIRSLGESE